MPGNHDLLVEGEVPPTPALQRLATGDRRLVEVDRSRLRSADALRADPPAAVAALLRDGALPGRSVPVAPDPDRRLLSPGELVARLRGASAAPKGGGPRMDYTFDAGPSVRGIVLDGIERDRDAFALSPAQLGWLRSSCARPATAGWWWYRTRRSPGRRAGAPRSRCWTATAMSWPH